MLIVCDKFDWTDFPAYVTKDRLLDRIEFYRTDPMHKIMELYDLDQDEVEQLNEHRCWRIPEKLVDD